MATGKALKTQNRTPQRTNATSATNNRSRTFPRGGTYLECENGTQIWGPSLDTIRQDCQQMLTAGLGAGGGTMTAGTNSGPTTQPTRQATHQRRPLSAAHKAKLRAAMQRRAAAGRKTMAAGS